jgi:hypothetical protein
MILPLLLAAATMQDAPAATAPVVPLAGSRTLGPIDEDRGRRCQALIAIDANAAIAEANEWHTQGGLWLAQRCLGLALSAQGQFAMAADAFDAAVREAQGRPADVARLQEQAGNAALASGDAPRARRALDAVIAANALAGSELSFALVDRARVLVALADPTAARADLDAATAAQPQNSDAWLLSATLARRQRDFSRASSDIMTALQLANRDAAIVLESGNIAAAMGDFAVARARWERAADLGEGQPEGTAAAAHLAELDAIESTTYAPATAPTPR